MLGITVLKLTPLALLPPLLLPAGPRRRWARPLIACRDRWIAVLGGLTLALTQAELPALF